jgi:hypothetical protein
MALIYRLVGLAYLKRKRRVCKVAGYRLPLLV